jgi:putative membrane protein
MTGYGPTLAALNATFNSLSALCIACGLLFIYYRRRWRWHMGFKVAAAVFSGAFLTFYLLRYYLYGSMPFRGQGLVRPVYFTLLWSHIILAMVEVPLIIATLWRAWRGLQTGDYKGHRRIARITYPIWAYVSVTGVIVYFMLYQVYR